MGLAGVASTGIIPDRVRNLDSVGHYGRNQISCNYFHVRKSIMSLIVLSLMGTISCTGQYVSDRFSHWRRKMTDEEIRAGIQLSFSPIDSPLERVHWCANGSMLVQTAHGDLLAENSATNTGKDTTGNKTDQFQHLESVKHILVEAAQRENSKHGAIVQPFSVTKFVSWEDHHDIVLIMTNTTLVFVTTNCGRYYKAMNFKSPPSKIIPHPIKNQVIIALVPSERSDLTVMLSQDLGDSWREVYQDVHDVAWVFSSKLHRNSKVNPDRLIILKHIQGRQTPQNLYSLYYSDDFFSTTHVLLEAGTTFAITQHFIYAARVEDASKKEVGLYVASIDAHRYNLKKVKLPFELLREHAYTVLEPLGRHVFIHVTHSIEEIPTGHLYVSDSTGSKFELNVKNNIRTAQGYCDFNKAQGMEGVYIANVYTDTSLARAKAAIKLAKSVEEKGQILSHSLKKKSLITYDFGRSWQSMHIDSSFNPKPRHKTRRFGGSRRNNNRRTGRIKRI